ncbi:transglutaminase domain-containing protein [Anthocerotibacter panamensis]|uniref:transglutaminase domain-containing protein n=1 Tax=Anthocerotibacter panamensis TaxID=2857077 RepID=UPI001C403189|nr:transglutaminase family protein [Anthocerotibacter panamensis]
MRLMAASHLVYQASDLTPSWLFILPSSTAAQTVLHESIHLTPPVEYREGHDPFGNRFLYFCMPPGRFEVHYEVGVQLQRSIPVAGLVAVPSLYVQPSRYCCPLQVQHLAHELFGGRPVDLDLAQSISTWVRHHLHYHPGSSTWETAASDSLVRCEGVCRDFAHSAIALCRALEIPARYCSTYALNLTPQDFHACCEMFVAGEWVRLDPSGLVLPEATIAIAHGRDVSDAPVASFAGWVQFLEHQVHVQLIAEPATLLGTYQEQSA